MTKGMTISEKILAAHAGLDKVSPGELITAKVDITLANDITGPVAIKNSKKLAWIKFLIQKGCLCTGSLCTE
jgi:homoaconitase/3-isopropylmalate dehydratase large subunit